MFSKKIQAKRIVLAALMVCGLAAGGMLGSAAPAQASPSDQFTMPQGVQSEGTYAKVNFRLWRSAPAWIQVGTSPLSSSAPYYTGNGDGWVKDVGVTSTPGTEYSILIPGLKPGTRYFATVHYYNPVDGVWQHDRNYGIQTKQRQVTIGLKTLSVRNAGDGGEAGECGEIHHSFTAFDSNDSRTTYWWDDQPVSHPDPSTTTYAYKTVCNGGTLNLNAHSSGPRFVSTDRLAFLSTTTDDDSNFWCGTCADKATGNQTMSLLPLDGPNGTQETWTKAFDVSDSTLNGVDATMHGSVSVSYVS
jgi:hypothetical protein